MGLTQITTGGVDDNINIDSNTLKVDGTNNRVGIATASPQANLDISPASSSATLRVHARTDSSPVPAIELVRGATSSFGTDTRQDFRLKNSGGELIVEYGQGGTTTEALRVNSVGRVGIGTTSPSQLLHLNGTNPFIYVEADSTTGNSGITFADGANKGQIMYDHDGDYMRFSTNGSSNERMRIDSSGRLYLGTTTAGFANGDDLNIATTGHTGITIRSGTTSTGNIFFADGTSSTAQYRGIIRYDHNTDAMPFFTAASEAMRIDSSGNVGIGTSSPSRSLQVSGSGSQYAAVTSTTSANAGILFGDSSDDDAGYVLYANSVDALLFGTGGATERMRIDSSGNVLVGTTDSTIYNNGDSDSEGIVLRDGEVVDIARKGDLQLTLNRQTNDGHHIGFFRSGSPKSYIATRNDGFCIDVNASERLRINSAGNVGIGTTSPSDLLEINPTSTREGLTLKTTGTTFGGINIDTNRTGAGQTLGDIRFMWDGTGVAGITGHTGSDTTNKDDGRLIFNTASSGSATERMRIDSSGRVGIGTASPAHGPLHVHSSTTAAYIHLTNSTTGSGTSDGFSLFSTGNDVVLDQRESANMRFFTANTEAMRIDSSGRLLVGTTSTLQANDKISVDGQVGIGGQRYGFLSKNVNVGNSVTFDIVGDVNNLVFVRVRITVGYTGNSNYQMHAQYDYLTCNFSTTGGSATITNIAQIESGNAQFNTSDWSVSRPANRTVRLTYSPSSGSGTHHPTVYVDGLFSTIS